MAVFTKDKLLEAELKIIIDNSKKFVQLEPGIAAKLNFGLSDIISSEALQRATIKLPLDKELRTVWVEEAEGSEPPRYINDLLINMQRSKFVLTGLHFENSGKADKGVYETIVLQFERDLNESGGPYLSRERRDRDLATRFI